MKELRPVKAQENRKRVAGKKASAPKSGPTGGEPSEREIAAAWAQDRSEQYTDKSSAKCALEDLAAELRGGEHIEAYRQGALDDLIDWARGGRSAEVNRDKFKRLLDTCEELERLLTFVPATYEHALPKLRNAIAAANGLPQAKRRAAPKLEGGGR